MKATQLCLILCGPMDCNSLGQNAGVGSLAFVQGIFPIQGSNPGLPHWRRLLRVPFTARRSNQFIQKEISPEYSLEGLTLKLKLQYFGHLMRRTDSLEKTLILGKIEGRRKRGKQKMDGSMVSLTLWT